MSGSTPRLGLPYPASSDLLSDAPATFQSLATKLDNVTPYSQGTYASRPSPVPVSGTYYWATDTSQLLVSDGSLWQLVAPQPALVTGLPSSPTDGQVVDFLADSANGVVWRLRYRAASSSTYKWERVGGAAMQAEILTVETTPGTSYGDCATVGPSVVLPLAGDYDISFGCYIDGDTTAGQILVAPKLGGAATSDNDSVAAYTSEIVSPARTIRRTGLTSGTTIKLQYKSPGAVSTFGRRFLAVTPVRCG